MNQKILGGIVAIAAVAVGGYFLVNKKQDILIIKDGHPAVELKDVKNYVQESTTDLVVTSGTVVGIKLTPYYNLVLSDGQGTYVLVNFGRAFTDKFAPIFSSLKIGDVVQVKGMADKTEGNLVVLDGNTSIETIAVEHASVFGMISLNEIQKIDLKDLEVDSSWKTYTNSDLGFSLDYPMSLREPNVVQLSTRSRVDFTKGFSVEVGFYYDQVKGKNVKVSEIIDAAKKDPKIQNVQTEDIKVDGHLATKVTYSSDYFGLNFTDVYIYNGPKDTANYILIASDNSLVKANTLDQILSTFKFVKQNTQVDTSNWKTYASEKDGFELKYPSSWSSRPGHFEGFGATSPNGIVILSVNRGPWYDDSQLNRNTAVFKSPVGVMRDSQFEKLVKLEDLVIKGYPSVHYTDEYLKGGHEAPGFESIWAVRVENFVYTLDFFTNGSKEEFEKESDVINKIISTIKFTN